MANTGLPAPLANLAPGPLVGVGDANSRFSTDPILVPDFYTPVVINGGVAMVSPNDLLSQAAYVRTNATATGTLSGVTASTDSVKITFTNGLLARSGGARSVTAVAGALATNASLADAIDNAIAQDPVLTAFGITSANLAAVLNIYQNGPVGNYTTVSYTAVSGAPVVTFSPVSGTLAGGGGAVVPFNTFPFTFGGQVFWFRARTPILVSPPMLSAMVSAGMPVS